MTDRIDQLALEAGQSKLKDLLGRPLRTVEVVNDVAVETVVCAKAVSAVEMKQIVEEASSWLGKKTRTGMQ